jgi:hypothetical protein
MSKPRKKTAIPREKDIETEEWQILHLPKIYPMGRNCENKKRKSNERCEHLPNKINVVSVA